MVADIDYLETALSVPIPSADNLVLDSARRLTGPGLLWDYPGTALDVFYQGFDPEYVAGLWHQHARRVLDAIGWTAESTVHRNFGGGVNLALSAPMDQLYSAIFVGQTAWHFCAAKLLDQESGDFQQMIADLRRVMAEEANPALIAMITAAKEHGVDVLCDDDHLSLGHGTGSHSWSVNDLPSPQEVDWAHLYDVPVVLITGTNGKTTTTRLSAAIAKASGKVAGLTSTDFVRVGDDYLDYGDYSGPGGARMLLRDTRLELAYLEVARGGILRRGLPLRGAKAAVVTNVSNDHLGQYGVNTVEDLAIAKFAVHRTLCEGGVLILNGDDAYVRAQAEQTNATIWWVSLEVDNPLIIKARASGSPCAWAEDGWLKFFDGNSVKEIAHVRDIPCTMDGAARYNMQNALSAICLSRAMGIDLEAIRQGLASFGNTPKDNPGRCNEFAVNGARVFVDFAHNPHSIAAVASAMAAIDSNKRYVLVSHAGDRSDQDIRDTVATTFAVNPDYLVGYENEGYLRGRELGEMTALIADEGRVQGLSDEQILLAPTPIDGVRLILDRVQPGDLALLLVHADRDQIFDLLEERSKG